MTYESKKHPAVKTLDELMDILDIKEDASAEVARARMLAFAIKQPKTFDRIPESWKQELVEYDCWPEQYMIDEGRGLMEHFRLFGFIRLHKDVDNQNSIQT